MRNLILAIMMFVLAIPLSAKFPTPQQVKADLAVKDSLKAVVEREYLSGVRSLDYTTQVALMTIQAEILSDFKTDSSSYGRVLIRFGSIDSVYSIDRAEFIRKKLEQDLKRDGWSLNLWILETLAISGKGGIYTWYIAPSIGH